MRLYAVALSNKSHHAEHRGRAAAMGVAARPVLAHVCSNFRPKTSLQARNVAAIAGGCPGNARVRNLRYPRSSEIIQVSLPDSLLSLFVCCMFCHGELSRLRPDARDLTEFYVMLSLGGAAGAIVVGLIAPRIFGGIYELPVTLVITAALALLLTWREGAWPIRLLWIAVTASMVVVLGDKRQGISGECAICEAQLLRIASGCSVAACRQGSDEDAISRDHRARSAILVAAFPFSADDVLRT